MKIICPTGRARPISIEGVERPSSLKGLRVGLLDNTKAPVDKILAHIDSRLRESFGVVETMYVSKAKTSIPASSQIMKDLKSNCDVLITALGD